MLSEERHNQFGKIIWKCKFQHNQGLRHTLVTKMPGRTKMKKLLAEIRFLSKTLAKIKQAIFEETAFNLTGRHSFWQGLNVLTNQCYTVRIFYLEPPLF